MAVRPLAFGARLRDRGRTVRVRTHALEGRGYVVEDADLRRSTRRRDHPTLQGALRDLARTWRGRLH